MLPEEISNNLCSLNPKKTNILFQRYLSFEGEKIIKKWFGKTIINSNERLSYNEAQYVIDNKTNLIPEQISLTGKKKRIDEKVSKAIIYINNIAQQLREKRHKKGSISFNKTEVKFVLDKNKEPIRTKIKIA